MTLAVARRHAREDERPSAAHGQQFAVTVEDLDHAAADRAEPGNTYP